MAYVRPEDLGSGASFRRLHWARHLRDALGSSRRPVRTFPKETNHALWMSYTIGLTFFLVTLIGIWAIREAAPSLSCDRPLAESCQEAGS